jgi:hypothetical protein
MLYRVMGRPANRIEDFPGSGVNIIASISRVHIFLDAGLPDITEINVANLLDRLATMSKEHLVNLAAESRIVYKELVHIFSASMLDD